MPWLVEGAIKKVRSFPSNFVHKHIKYSSHVLTNPESTNPELCKVCVDFFVYFDSQARIGFEEIKKKFLKTFVNSGFMKTCDEQVNRA